MIPRMEASLESLYLVGSVVIDELLANWAKYAQRTPTPSDLP